MKKFMDIPRIGHKTTLDYFAEIAAKRLNIQISIKFDGANAQFDVSDTDELNVYSRTTVLNEEVNLRGFYQYIHEKVDPKRIPKGYKVFGEWLVSHTVLYPEDAYNHFYLFDIFDSEKCEYVNPNSEIYQEIKKYLVDELGMKSAQVLYEGPYQGMGHIEEMLKLATRQNVEYVSERPQSMEDVFNEGIVIKAYDYIDWFGNQMFVKFVGERFQEVKKVKVKEPKGPDNSVEKQIADFAVTKARVEKIINKLIDEAILPEDLELEHMRIISQNIPKRVYDDVMKEEYETIINEFGEFDEKLIGKKINSVAISISKDIIMKKIEKRVSLL